MMTCETYELVAHLYHLQDCRGMGFVVVADFHEVEELELEACQFVVDWMLLNRLSRKVSSLPLVSLDVQVLLQNESDLVESAENGDDVKAVRLVWLNLLKKHSMTDSLD